MVSRDPAGGAGTFLCATFVETGTVGATDPLAAQTIVVGGTVLIAMVVDAGLSGRTAIFHPGAALVFAIPRGRAILVDDTVGIINALDALLRPPAHTSPPAVHPVATFIVAREGSRSRSPAPTGTETKLVASNRVAESGRPLAST